MVKEAAIVVVLSTKNIKHNIILIYGLPDIYTLALRPTSTISSLKYGFTV